MGKGINLFSVTQILDIVLARFENLLRVSYGKVIGIERLPNLFLLGLVIQFVLQTLCNKEDELVITMGGHNGYTIPFYDKDARRVRDEIENYLHTYSAEKGA